MNTHLKSLHTHCKLITLHKTTISIYKTHKHQLLQYTILQINLF